MQKLSNHFMACNNMKRTKTIVTALAFLLLCRESSGQLFKELFRQNSTQREYLKEQIAQLKIYLELTKKGYKIAKEGLGAIHQIKSDEFKLHKNRFDSLLIVKSEITSLTRLQHISDLHGAINEICEKLPEEIRACKGLGQPQKKQFEAALEHLYDDSQVLVYGFFAVIRDKQLTMTDDQRVNRIEFYFSEFEKNYLFATDLRRQIGLVCRQVKNELDDIENRRALHGTN